MYEDNDYNRYTNLDTLEWRIIASLLKSNTKHAQNIWKMLAYPTEDCLFKDNVEFQKRYELIYTGNGDATGNNDFTNKKVFNQPYIDDAWGEQASRLDIFVKGIEPINHITSRVHICTEIIVHNKINNIYGDGEDFRGFQDLWQPEDNTKLEFRGNPSELDESGQSFIIVKSRATTLLKSILAELNGKFIAGVGKLQHNLQLGNVNVTQQQTWNNRAYFGYSVVFTTILSGVSDSPEVGY